MAERRDRDEPVSLARLDPETALRALLAVQRCGADPRSKDSEQDEVAAPASKD